jgi:hypothetical protein
MLSSAKRYVANMPRLPYGPCHARNANRKTFSLLRNYLQLFESAMSVWCLPFSFRMHEKSRHWARRLYDVCSLSSCSLLFSSERVGPTSLRIAPRACAILNKLHLLLLLLADSSSFSSMQTPPPPLAGTGAEPVCAAHGRPCQIWWKLVRVVETRPFGGAGGRGIGLIDSAEQSWDRGHRTGR